MCKIYLLAVTYVIAFLLIGICLHKFLVNSDFIALILFHYCEANVWREKREVSNKCYTPLKSLKH